MQHQLADKWRVIKTLDGGRSLAEQRLNVVPGLPDSSISGVSHSKANPASPLCRSHKGLQMYSTRRIFAGASFESSRCDIF